MKEADIRKAIGLDTTLTTSQKYTLIMLLTRLDWDTWTGNVSARDIAKVSSQGERQVKRHLSGLKSSGWLERLSEKRADTPMINHKADTRLNVELAKSILDISTQTSPPTPIKGEGGVTCDTSDDNDTSGNNDTGDTNDTSDDNDTGGVSDVTQGGCQYSHRGSGESDTGGVSISTHNNNSYQLFNNSYNQSKINLLKQEDRMDPTREDYLQEGWVWCERCKAWTPKDEPHFYPNTDIECSEAQPTPEQVKAMEWDQAWGKHSPEVEEPVERRDGFIYYLNEIPDELTYKREVMRVIDHYDRYDVRMMLWNRREGDALFTRMMRELIAPRSCIEWVTIQAGGEVSSATEPPPPKPSQTYTVTVDQQRKIKEIDQAWMTGATNGGNDSW